MPETTEGLPFWDKGFRITNILNLDGIIENTTYSSHTKLMAFALKENVEKYFGSGFFFLTCDNETLSYYIKKAGEVNNYEITAIQCLLARAEGELELEIEMIQKTRLSLMFLIMFEVTCRMNRTVPNYQAYTMFTENMQGLVFGKPLSYFHNVFVLKGIEALNQEVQNAIKEVKE